MAIRNLFPEIKPSLNLDFANTKQLDPRVTFTRSTSGSYYDGKTFAKAEENLLTYSQDFYNAAWGRTAATVTANATTAPDGTSTADTLNGSAGSAYANIVAPVTTGLVYVLSLYAKANSTNFLQLTVASSNFGVNVWANFDLSAGTVGAVGSAATAGILSVGNGWYRCVLVGTATATSTAVQIPAIIPVESSTAVRVPTNAGTTSIHIWGAQLEQRSAVTAYTPTTTQPITNYIPVLLTAPAGVARFDHNPVTGESLGLLIEESRANIAFYSQQFDNAWWTKAACSISAEATVAPDGTLTADRLIVDTANDYHSVNRAAISAANYSISVYAKSAGYRYLQLCTTGNSEFANFDLQSGALGTFSTGSNASITHVGNGWYRCSYTPTTQSTAIQIAVVSALTSARQAIFAGDGYSGIYIWGAQLDAPVAPATSAAFATSYIPTTTAGVTRAADAASFTTTTKGTLIVRNAAGVMSSSEKLPGAVVTLSSCRRVAQYPVTLTAGQISALTS